ncbi:MAG TPA: class I SAM-dependent methyltransferase [Candidatus Krumholzibacteria bacterium]|nr:class I SAM-dependent methyltransferase [Candidatus Krumholzibacteria bacterium]
MAPAMPARAPSTWWSRTTRAGSPRRFFVLKLTGLVRARRLPRPLFFARLWGYVRSPSSSARDHSGGAAPVAGDGHGCAGVRRHGVRPDIGAGSGYFTFRLCPLVPEGKVVAVDIQQEMLDMIYDRMSLAGIENVVPVLGDIDDPKLPAGAVDLALLVDAYHEFSHPREMLRGIYRGLRPGGRVVLVEYRAEDPDIPILPLHKMSEDQCRAELGAAGFIWVETREDLPWQHVMIFRKPAE